MPGRTLEWSGPIEVGKDFQEKVAHGDPLFHMSVHYTRLQEDQKVILYYHWHEELEFLFMTRGEARFQVAGENFHVRENDIVVVRPNQVHAASAVNHEPVEFYAVLIHYDFVGNLVNDLVNQKYVRPLYGQNQSFPVHLKYTEKGVPHLLALLGQIRDAYREEEDGYELLVKAKVFELFYGLSRYAGGPGKTGREAETYNTLRVKQAVQYIEQNYSRKISLTEMAGELNMSEGHFCRFFKEQTGMTLVEYLNGYRITEAARQIKTSGKKMLEIAMDCGFTNINYFTTVFKRTFGCTPAEYRQKDRRISSG